MRKIMVTEFITLDGVVEAPGGNETDHPHGGWQTQFRGAESGQYKLDELASVDTLLLGKNTFDSFSAYWPTQAGTPFGDRINQYNKYVVSTTLPSTNWQNSHILRDVANEVAALKNTAGGNILVYGSATLVKSLLHHNLVDELRLLLYPVAIGGGLRIFGEDRELRSFQLKRAHPFQNGVVLLEYDRAL